MTDSPFVPACLRSSTPRVEVRDRRSALTPTLAGYALRPGSSYQVRVSVPGRHASEWKLRREDHPAVLNQFEAGDSDETSQELCFHVPWWPESFLKSLAAGDANLTLSVSFPGTSQTQEKITVPMHLKPSPLGLLLALISGLLPLIHPLQQVSQWFVETAKSRYQLDWNHLWVTGGLCVLVWLVCTTAYLWWKKRFQPARRVRSLRRQMLSQLQPVP
jgi:hypothetical protein